LTTKLPGSERTQLDGFACSTGQYMRKKEAGQLPMQPSSSLSGTCPALYFLGLALKP